MFNMDYVTFTIEFSYEEIGKQLEKTIIFSRIGRLNNVVFAI